MHIPHLNLILSRNMLLIRPGGGIGRRKGLKIPREQSRACRLGPGHMKSFTILCLTLYWLAVEKYLRHLLYHRI